MYPIKFFYNIQNISNPLYFQPVCVCGCEQVKQTTTKELRPPKFPSHYIFFYLFLGLKVPHSVHCIEQWTKESILYCRYFVCFQCRKEETHLEVLLYKYSFAKKHLPFWNTRWYGFKTSVSWKWIEEKNFSKAKFIFGFFFFQWPELYNETFRTFSYHWKTETEKSDFFGKVTFWIDCVIWFKFESFFLSFNGLQTVSSP